MGSKVMAIRLSDRFAQNIPDDRLRLALMQTVEALATAAVDISGLCAMGPLAGALGKAVGTENTDGDEQKALDVQADDIVVTNLRKAPVAYYVSEERDDISTFEASAPISLAVDPLDGSSNIDTNVSVGTIFSIFQTVKDDPEGSFMRPGDEQIAAGCFVYGPQTALLITAGDGVEQYVLNPATETFELAIPETRIPVMAFEYAINASNDRHWAAPVKYLIDDFCAGEDGPMGKNFNMRWVASLVAEATRILSRGGVFLYPGDDRKGYDQGRLRLLYEAAAMAMLTEQAGGEATDGKVRILDKTPQSIHARTPLVFGSSDLVRLVGEYHANPELHEARAPLFNQRGLFS